MSEGTTEREQHPRHQPIELEVPDERFGVRNWRV